MFRPTVTTVERNGRIIEVSTLPYNETCLFWKRPGHTCETSQIVDLSGKAHAIMVAKVRQGDFDDVILQRESEPH